MPKKLHAGHIEISSHSPQQRAMFFGLANKLGYKTEDVKDRVIKRFGLSCFNALTKTHMDYLIEELMEVQNKKTGEKLKATLTGSHIASR